MQSLRCAVNGSGQTSRTSTYDREIVEAGLGASTHAYLLCNFCRSAVQNLGAIGEQHDREFTRIAA